MQEWWLVREVKYKGILSTDEWATLAAHGKCLSLHTGECIEWGAEPGVILVDEGDLNLRGGDSTRSSMNSIPLIELHSGDMSGVVYPVPYLLEARTSSTLHTFTHYVWLATLFEVPHIADQLLRGVARRTLQTEQRLWSECGMNSSRDGKHS